MVRTNLSEILKMEQKILASYVIAPQSVKVTAMVCDKCLSKAEKAFD